ncbi:MAG: M42 family metallopeptidase [Clostridia bacterium]|nr:M42 family metallopeptidase [Clostridia bacterium]
MIKDTIKKLVKVFGPSGQEELISDTIKDMARPYCDEAYNDTLGNLICVKKGHTGRRIMFSAHMDTIGFIVVAVDEKGFLKVANVGGIMPLVSVAREVVFRNGIKGVMYYETKGARDATNMPTLPVMYVDIGCSTKEEAEAKVSVGDMCVYSGNITDMGKRMSSPYMDNRVCCAIMLEAMKTARSNHDLYFVFTVQEEVGLRGAGPAAYGIDPDLNINIDTTLTGDMPNVQAMDLYIGKGPAIKMMDSSVIVPMSVRNFMIKAAEEADIPYQREVLRAGGTDTAAIQKTKAGVLAGCISIGTRYVHTPVETVDMDDVNNAIALVEVISSRNDIPEQF